MARTDRLMRLMDTLRRLPAPVTADRLAEETGVSRRQLYRDIATLRAGGALIDGEAGLGYRLTEDPALPPQSFSRLEIEALRLSVDALPRVGDPDLIAAARNALARIVATLPERQAMQATHVALRSFSPPTERMRPTVDMEMIRDACWEEDEIHLVYRDMEDRVSERDIRPLGMSYSEKALLLLAWCKLREDFRMFHCNRIVSASLTGISFRPHRVSLLRDYVGRMRSRAEPCPIARRAMAEFTGAGDEAR
ncbi:YafY family transcriptional regulator [Paracoccus aurantiacus]|uniref:YafY family transcriptional regulator n=1 Tax=Paracoccus aurantiacus TaxID=2599412 RepID=A0A5C6S5B2_9RHOB|nr:YafY family protein [Paracoccus aurantiacus]TXB69696.1 YafY family transcriptional regulator [Paracoccus aurantiacus]